MDYDIFKTEEEKAEVRKALIELVEHPGWKILVKVLDANTQYFTEARLNKIEQRDFASLDELYAFQDRINDLEQYKELPINVLKAVMPEPDEKDEDIYDEMPPNDPPKS